MEGRRADSAVTGALYRARRDARAAERDRLERRHATFAWTRLALFGLAVVIVAVLGRASAPWLVVPILLFVPLAFAHARTLNARDRAARSVRFYERGLARLDDRWQGGGQFGERFRDPAHLYAEDLDLFGRGSLFELLATARTSGGEGVLAGWLTGGAEVREIRDRQQAVDELAPRLDLHEDLAVLGPEVAETVRTDDLAAWATAPLQLPERWPRIVLPMVAAVTTALVLHWLLTGEPSSWLVVAGAVQIALARYFRRRVHEVAHHVEARERELEVLSTLMERLEREPLDTRRLRALQAALRGTGRSPAGEIRGLARRVDLLSSGHNLFFAPISALLLLGTQLAFAVERWRARCGPAVPGWLRAVEEAEALAALATYRAEHPADSFPEFVDDGPLFEARALAHPLLPAAAAVPNDVTLGGSAPRLLVVSGSNMSGKSTLLRTVGLNAVLAHAGAPVRAATLRLSPLTIGATLRIQDSLQEGRSRFFAEISRISEVVSRARAPATGAGSCILFLFDELLSGTNSHDRLQGATGILSGLIGMGAIGLVTTHDLALAKIVDGLDGRAANVHFEDRFENGVLQFEYRLHGGVVQTSNAIALMRSVGLEV